MVLLVRRTFSGNIYKEVEAPNLVGAHSGYKQGHKTFLSFRGLQIQQPLLVESQKTGSSNESLTADRNIFQCFSIWAKKKNAENQLISVLCSVLPLCLETPVKPRFIVVTK